MEHGDSLPSYEDSQRQAVKDEREAYYKQFSAGIRAAECAYEGSTGLRLPPGNIISYVLRKAYRVKKTVATSFDGDTSDSDTEQAEVLVPGYTHQD